MGILERHRIKKLHEEAQVNTISNDKTLIEVKENLKKRRKDKIKYFIPLVLGLLLSGLIDYQILKGQYGNDVSIIGTAITEASMGLIVIIIIIRSYKPPADLFVNIELTDPENPESTYKIEKWLIPRPMIESIKEIGQNYTIDTIDGLAFVTEHLDYNYTTGKLTIKFGYMNLDRFAFLTDKSTFERQTGILERYRKKTELQDTYMETMIEERSREKADRRIEYIFNAKYESEREKVNKNTEKIKQEITDMDREIKDLTINKEENENEE